MIKEQAGALVKNLPDNATWEDLMYKNYVCKNIETGLNDVRNGQVKPVEDIRKRL